MNSYGIHWRSKINSKSVIPIFPHLHMPESLRDGIGPVSFPFRKIHCASVVKFKLRNFKVEYSNAGFSLQFSIYFQINLTTG